METAAHDTPSPLVNLFSFNEGDTNDEELRLFGKEVIEAFDNFGYVYVEKTGLEAEEVTRLAEDGDKFFIQDEVTKEKYKRDMNTYVGYSTGETEIVDKNLKPEEKCLRNIFDFTGQQNLFIREVPEFCDSVATVTRKIIPLVRKILRAIELGLDAPAGMLTSNHQYMMEKGNLTDLRIIQYVPPANEIQTSRLEAHYDFSTITLQLFGDLKGLELFSKQGEWQSVTVQPGYILLFPGETIQYWTGGRIQALKHRVVIPTDAKEKKKTRHAIILFVTPDDDTDIRAYDGNLAYPSISARKYADVKARIYYKDLFVK